MDGKRSEELRGFTLPDDLHARLSRLGYRQVDISDVSLLEGYRLYNAERDGVYSFVAVDEQPRPYPLLVTGTYFCRRSDENETTNSELERNALPELIGSLEHVAWRRLYPSRWHQLFIRHRFAITTAVTVAILSGVFVYIDSVSSRMNVFSFVNSLSARLGDFGETNRGLLIACTKILFVLATTTVGYWIASLIGVWRHPIMSVDLSESFLKYYYGPEACRVIDDLAKERKEPSAPTPDRTGVATTVGGEPAPWHGYDNFVDYEEFQKRLRLEAKRATRFAEPMSCLIMTVEPVRGEGKAIVGDIEPRIYRECSQLIWHEIREIDSFARYGDSGFIILLPNTEAEGAQTVDKRLRTKVGSCDVGGCSVADAATIRTGMSSIVAGQRTEWEELVREAESSLRVMRSAQE